MNPNHKPWTQRDLDTLRREYPRRTAAEVAQMLGRSEMAITNRAHNLGLKKAHHGLIWTPQMLTLLRALYPITFGRALAATLGVSFRSLTRKARELGLEKEPGFLEKRKADILNLAGEAVRKAYREGRIKTTFKPGVRANPDGEFKPGHRESQEVKAKRSASLKRAWVRRKQQAKYVQP